MRRLEALRLELDSRRRTVADLQGRCERVRANLGTTRARGEVDMEITLRKMQVRAGWVSEPGSGCAAHHSYHKLCSWYADLASPKCVFPHAPHVVVCP
jgi:hypothetical protein